MENIDNNDKVTKQKINKYRKLTAEALKIAKKNVVKGKERQAEEIIEMVEAYVSDSEHFELKKQFVNSLSCLNYAHGLLDCGARLRIFNVKDNRLFTV